ncbi:MAG: dipeptide epimerase [Bacteroidetes bacterium]|nr:dipeptide epimerase [Bacteroidota bacterium]
MKNKLMLNLILTHLIILFANNYSMAQRNTKSDLTISKIEIYKVDLELKEHQRLSQGVLTHAKIVVIKVFTQSGIYGTGEVTPLTILMGETQESCFEMAKILGNQILGKNSLEINRLVNEMDNLIPGNSGIKSAFDMALYDIAAKHAGLPLYQFLGGSNKNLIIDRTIFIDTPEKMADRAELLVNNGIKLLKVKLGDGVHTDIDRIKAIRNRIGIDIPIKVDANQGWNEVEAIQVIRELEKYNIEYIEQPIAKDNFEGMARLKSKSNIPIMADETVWNYRDAARLLILNGCDLMNIKLAKSGGIYNAQKIAAIAESADIDCMVGCMQETRFGLTALAHFVMANNIIKHYDMDSNFALKEDPVEGGIVFIDDYYWILPSDKIGIGADFKQEYLDKSEKFIIK